MSKPYCVAFSRSLSWYIAYKSKDRIPRLELSRRQTSCPRSGKRKAQCKTTSFSSVQSMVTLSGIHQHGLGKELAKWLPTTLVTKDSIQNCRIAFGGGVTCYTRASAGSKWNRLPETLGSEIDEAMKCECGKHLPTWVALGVKNA